MLPMNFIEYLTSFFSRTPPRDFYAQSHKKDTSMLKDNSKRLPLLSHN